MIKKNDSSIFSKNARAQAAADGNHTFSTSRFESSISRTRGNKIFLKMPQKRKKSALSNAHSDCA
jgi:hypothetical protein